MPSAKVIVIRTKSFWGGIKTYVKRLPPTLNTENIEVVLEWAVSNFEKTKNLVGIEVYEKEEVFKTCPRPLALLVSSKYVPKLFTMCWGGLELTNANNLPGIENGYLRMYCKDILNFSTPEQIK